jgi:hypothetical protein
MTCPGWTSAYLNLVVLIQDVNSNTNQLYWGADYAVIQQWDTGPKIALLAKNFSLDQGQIPGGIYNLTVLPQGNNIVVTVTQKGFDTNSVYNITASVLMGQSGEMKSMAAART